MKYQIYSIYDSAAAVYSQPFYFGTDAVAMRGFQDLVAKADPENKYYAHPEDYSLWHIGTFNDGTGIVTATDLNCLVMGHEAKAHVQNNLPAMESTGETLTEQMHAARGPANGQ